MSRSHKGGPRCPEGHKCGWCGGKAGADHRDAKKTHGRRKRIKEATKALTPPEEAVS